MTKSYYELFGIKESASKEEISEAYHKLIFKYHPDRNQGNKKYEEITKKVIFIHDQLTDPLKRFEYDKELAEERSKESTKYYGNADKLWEEEINNEIHYANHYPNPPKQEEKGNQKKSYNGPKSTVNNASQEANTNKYDHTAQPSNDNITQEASGQNTNIKAPPKQIFAKVFAVILLIGIIVYSYLISQKFQ